jgi:capsular exopolysaccharide synthesis family protein
MSSGAVGTSKSGAGKSRSSDRVTEGFGQALVRHRWIVASIFLLNFSIGIGLSFHQVPLYTSESKLLFEQYATANPGTNAGQDGGSAGTASVNGPYLQSQADLVVSTPVVSAAAEALKTRFLRSLAGSGDVTRTIQSQLVASVKPEDGTISVSYSCPVAADSAAIVNSVVSSYCDYEQQHRKITIGEQLVELQQQKNTLDGQVVSAHARLEAFKKANPEVSFSDGATLSNQKLAKWNEQLTDAQTDYSNVTEKYEALAAEMGPEQGAQDNQPPAGGDNSVDVAWVQGELNRASVNVDTLISRGLPPTDPTLQDARAYLARMHDKLLICQRNAAVAQLADLKKQQAMAMQHQIAAQAAFDSQKRTVAELGTKATELAGLEDQLQRAQRSSDDLASKISQIVVAQDIPLDVRILEKAEPAGNSWSWRFRYAGMAAGAGLLLGLCTSLGLHLTDGRLRTAEQAASMTGLQLLGKIPHQGQTDANLGLRSHMDPMSDLAEAARSVRTALFAAARSTPAKTVLITSPGQGDGKTTFAANLAISMAQAGNRTLLIDASFGQQFLQQTFDVRKVSGFSNVLAGHISVETAICRTPVERLEMLPSGQKPPNPEILLNSSAFHKLMEYVCGRYQCVIVDAPALAGSSDARILSASADISLLVLRLGRTDSKVADAGLEQLLSVGARVLGVVVNDTPASAGKGRARGLQVGLDLAAQAEPVEQPRRSQRSPERAPQRRRAITGLAVKKKDSDNSPDIEVLD